MHWCFNKFKDEFLIILWGMNFMQPSRPPVSTCLHLTKNSKQEWILVSRHLGAESLWGGRWDTAELWCKHTFVKVFLPPPFISLYSILSFLSMFYSLTSLRRLWHWKQGLSTYVSNRKDTPRAAIGWGGVSSSYPPSITSSLFLRTPVLLSLVVPFHVCLFMCLFIFLWPRLVTIQMFLSLILCYQCLLLLSSFLCFTDSKEF